MSDVHAERAPEALMDPTDPRGTLGTHVVAANGRAAARRGVTSEQLPNRTPGPIWQGFGQRRRPGRARHFNTATT